MKREPAISPAVVCAGAACGMTAGAIAMAVLRVPGAVILIWVAMFFYISALLLNKDKK